MADQKTILLVEDEPLLSNLLKQRLEKDGYTVIAAHDGKEALELLEQGTQPDLVLLDIILPKVSGFELMEEVRANPQVGQVPIIVISNLGQESDVTKGKELGAIGYFVKAQLSIEDLATKIEEYLNTQN